MTIERHDFESNDPRDASDARNDPRYDPRWTSYVLGEMDPVERARFEQEIEDVPEAEDILNEIRETVGLVGDAVPTEILQLTEAQRTRIETSIPVRGPWPSGLWKWSSAVGIAALVLVGFVTMTMVRQPESVPIADNQTIPSPIGVNGLTDAGLTTSVGGETVGDVTSLQPVETAASSEPGLEQQAPTAAQDDESTPVREVFRFGRRVRVDSVSGEAELADTAQNETRVDRISPVNTTPEPAESIPLRLQANALVAGNTANFGPTAAPPPPPPAPAPRAAAGSEEARPGTLPRSVDRFRNGPLNTEEYARINDNPFLTVADEPLATFSVDVDTASYANVRRFLTQRTLPPPDAVRIEEMVNYFTYDYDAPTDGRPVRVNAEAASAPWNSDHRLVRIGIQGERIDWEDRAPTNLVFLIDVSGSMNSPDKLGLLRDGMKLLVEELGENDRVAIVVYAGNSGLVLPTTTGDRQSEIIRALDRLQAGGSTNGGAGIQLAYDTAIANFIAGGVNRVILATDGDFNVGVTNNGDLTRLIEEKAESGVFLSVLGFGTGNLNDAGMEALADRGNGNYGYIDSIREARKVLVEEMGGTLITIAKDVKFQVEFNPAEVSAYRLIGYENRLLENQDFNDDTKDAGDIGAGHTVTALFEVVPVGVDLATPGVDPLRYQNAPVTTDLAESSGELLTVKVRYKEPDQDTSLLIDTPLRDSGRSFDEATSDFRFASSVAAFGMILRNSPHRGDATFDLVLDVAESSLGDDAEGYRAEFVDLVRRARAISDLDDGREEPLSRPLR